MIVLGSDFSGLVPVLCMALIAWVLGAISFYPAWRGHWSALVLIAPLFIVGNLWAVGVYANAPMLEPGAYLLLLSPLIVSLTSIGLWLARMRGRRRRRPEPAGFMPVLSKKQGT